jgi:hypothetical protein
MTGKSKELTEVDIDRRRDQVLHTMLNTPPQPNWKPTNVRKKKRAKRAAKPKAIS